MARRGGSRGQRGGQVARKPLKVVGGSEISNYAAVTGQGATAVVQDDNFTQPTDYQHNPTAVAGGFPASPAGVGIKLYDAATGGNLLGTVTSYRMGGSNPGNVYKSIFLTTDKTSGSLAIPSSGTIYYEPRATTGTATTFDTGNGYNKTGQYLNQFPTANQIVLLNPKSLATANLVGQAISGKFVAPGTTIKTVGSFDGSQTAEAYTPHFIVTLSTNLTTTQGVQGTVYNYTVGSPTTAATAAPTAATAAPTTTAPTYNLPQCLDYTKISPGASTPACDRVTVFGKPKFVEYNFSIPVGTYNTLDEIKKIPGNNGYTIYGGDGNVSFAFPTNKKLKMTINNGPNFSGPITYVYTKTCPDAMTTGSCGQVTWNPAWKPGVFAQSIKVELVAAGGGRRRKTQRRRKAVRRNRRGSRRN